MRAIVAVAIGGVFLALALDLITLDEPVPVPLRIILGIFSLILVWGGLYHGRLRLRRYSAYRVGREMRGTLRLAKRIDEDDSIAEVIFSSGYRSWLLTVDSSGVPKAVEDGLQDVIATAYFGEDELIYGVDLGKKKLMPLSPGKPVSREDADKRGLDDPLAERRNQNV